MKKQAGFAAVFAASVLWLLFVIDFWENGIAIPLPAEVFYISGKGNTAYAVSAGLPAAAFCLLCAIPRMLKCIFPRRTAWKRWYGGAAGVLLTAQTVCMLPASRWFAAFARSILGQRAGAVMKKMLACYVHAILPALALCVICALVCVCADLRRAPYRIPHAVRQNGLHFVYSMVISCLVAVASLLVLNILDSWGIVNKAFIHGFCYQNASNAVAARVSVVWAPVVEEIAFRGLICKGLEKYGRRWPAILISAVFFGLWHRNMTQFAYTVLWGVIFGYVVLTTRTVLWPMLMHAASNLLVILAYSDAPSMVFGAWPRLWAFRIWLGNLPVVFSALALTAIIAVVVILLRYYHSGTERIPAETN